ncbi:nuclear transport factor 2 family protein [Frateuria aurantia]|uniref:SnoaL-like domain-containing protein n=1 Tax=Frateuria aurantia (strain ATCC 33424 / DSM 6220 / KCTC 2777 / LMG 1558 / NBRC 3245 / NCIMB 13370) TaxID=767434 RepID=H8L1I6_FRAAD|nr:nuclear transport factor 2 family protein [Frateuria aurantia]AFC84714.1 hypothetical protein Fraau_0217 [Frateuria aurantia DSM 6220]
MPPRLPTVLGLLIGISTCAALHPAMAGTPPLPPPDAIPQPRDLQQEQANLQLVHQFYLDFFARHDIAAAYRVVAPDYIQHNPNVADGRAAFVSHFTSYFARHPQASASISQYGSFGDRVFLRVHSTADPDDRGRAIVDIFRVSHGRIVEHWDSVQDVPATAENGNTMF